MKLKIDTTKIIQAILADCSDNWLDTKSLYRLLLNVNVLLFSPASIFNYQDFETDDSESDAYWEQYDNYEEEEEDDDEFELHQGLSELVSQLPQRQKKLLGHQIQTMLVSCSFNGKKCGPK